MAWMDVSQGQWKSDALAACRSGGCARGQGSGKRRHQRNRGQQSIRGTHAPLLATVTNDAINATAASSHIPPPAVCKPGKRHRRCWLANAGSSPPPCSALKNLHAFVAIAARLLHCIWSQCNFMCIKPPYLVVTIPWICSSEGHRPDGYRCAILSVTQVKVNELPSPPSRYAITAENVPLESLDTDSP